MRSKRFLSFILILTLLTTLIIPAHAAGGSFTLSVTKGDGSSVTTVHQGEEVNVTISSPEIPHTTMEGGIGIWLNFDHTKFQMVGTAQSAIPGCDVALDVTDEAIANTSGTVKANSSNVTAGMSDGQLVVSAKFKAIASGTAEFSVTVYEISDMDGNDHASEYTAPTPITVTIKAGTSSITITDDPSKTYDGNVVADPSASATGSTGTVSYTYYTDEGCTTQTDTAHGAATPGAAPKNAGDYWVKATVAADGSYGGATSAAKKFTISRAVYTYT